MSIINWAIYIDTGTSITDADLGISSGKIRWVTGRPGYDGFIPYPTWGPNEVSSGEILWQWFEGIILKDGMSSATRGMGSDIEKYGTYGNVGGFDLSISATGIISGLLDADVFLTGRDVNVYCVIDDVFYQCWAGVVLEVEKAEAVDKIICDTLWSKFHGYFPPQEINSVTFPSAKESTYGKSIPVCIGDIEHALAMSVQSSPETVVVVKSGEKEYKTCAAFGYTNSFPAEIMLYTPGVTFSANELGTGEYYLRVVSGSGDPDTDRIYQIAGNFSTFSPETTLFLEALPDKLLIQDDLALYDEVTLEPNSIGDTWYFEIVKAGVNHIVSNGEIENIGRDESSRPVVNKWDEQHERYTDVSEFVIGTDNTSDNDVGHPNISVATKQVDDESTLAARVFYTPSVDKITNDRDRSTPEIVGTLEYDPLNYLGGLPSVFSISDTFNIVVEIPEKMYGGTYESVIIAPDMFVNCSLFPEGVSRNGEYTLSIKTIDPYGFVSEQISDGLTESYSLAAGSSVKVSNMLPNDYYSDGGNDDGQASDYATKDSEGTLAINSDTLGKINAGKITNTVVLSLDISVSVSPGVTQPVNWQVSSVGIIGVKQLNLGSDKIYAHVLGELDRAGTEPTNNIPAALDKMMQYDGLPQPEGFSSLQSARRLWHVGRQVTDRKKTYEYIKELSRQGMFAVYPTRTGNIGVTAWTNIDSDGSILHSDTTNIIRGSISEISSVDSRNIYNQFSLKYEYNPNTNGFDAQLGINGVDEISTFPLENAVDAEGRIEWKKYVFGVGDYLWAKDLWEACRRAYDIIKVVNEFPEADSKLYWYTDYRAFRELSSLPRRPGVDSAAFRYLVELINYTTSQKGFVTYSLPLTPANLELELMTPISFRDTILTNGMIRTGWITQIEIRPDDGVVVITSMLRNNQGYVGIDYVEEIGDAGTTINETGTQPDTISEV